MSIAGEGVASVPRALSPHPERKSLQQLRLMTFVRPDENGHLEPFRSHKLRKLFEYKSVEYFENVRMFIFAPMLVRKKGCVLPGSIVCGHPNR